MHARGQEAIILQITINKTIEQWVALILPAQMALGSFLMLCKSLTVLGPSRSKWDCWPTCRQSDKTVT